MKRVEITNIGKLHSSLEQLRRELERFGINIDELRKEILLVRGLADTNFAACGCSGTGVVAVHERFNPMTEGSGTYIQQAVEWLYKCPHEKRRCDAPTYINCDRAFYDEAKNCDECALDDGYDCPFAKKTGVWA